jgi:hypothetical protein
MPAIAPPLRDDPEEDDALAVVVGVGVAVVEEPPGVGRGSPGENSKVELSANACWTSSV